jgi:acetyl-CoA carboxylase beta subunit
VAAIEPTPAVQAAAQDPAPTVVDAVTGGAQIQIGIFSVEDNANRAVATLAKAGVIATIRK